MPPKPIKKAIKDTLENLGRQDFNKFCSALVDREEEPRVPRGKVEDEDFLVVTDALVSTFCESGALQVTLETLRGINCNKDAESLESKTKAFLDKGDPTFRKTPTGDLETEPSQEALKHVASHSRSPVKEPEEVQADAKACVLSEGGNPRNVRLVRSRFKIQFGKYKGQTFKWLLENDVGYAAFIVTREDVSMCPSLTANKASFIEYTKAYPEFLKVKSRKLAEDGQRVVGFGVHKSLTLKELYEDPRNVSYVNFLRKKKECVPGSKMEIAIEYILLRDQRATASRLTPNCAPLRRFSNPRTTRDLRSRRRRFPNGSRGKNPNGTRRTTKSRY